MAKKRLILAYPNMRWQKEDLVTMWNLEPTTLCLLAQMVRDMVEVKIIDAQFHDMGREQFVAQVAAYKPDYVGLSLLTSEYAETLDIAAGLIKKIDPAITVIVGGVHATTMPEFVMRNHHIDYCVIGEGEYVLRDLLLYFQGEGELPAEGLAYRHQEELIIQKAARVADLTRLPWPAYDLVDYSAYLSKVQRSYSANNPPEFPFVRMVTTRGCPFGCLFCQVETIAGRKVRARDPEDVVKELLYLKKTYGIRSLVFDEDNLLMGPNDYARRLFSLMVEHKVGLKWIASAFALFLLNDELLDLMKASGCVGINVAIESGNPRVLKEIVGKPIKDLERVPAIIDSITRRGIYCIANFIIGFPGETWDEIRETIAFAERCGADYVKIYGAVPLYKTRLFGLAKEKGLLVCNDEIPKVDWRYGQILSDEWTPKDISILRAYEWDRINFRPEKLMRLQDITGATLEEIKRMRKMTRDSLIF
ncbi:MAG: radical SAM protein [Desulfobacteraceae bacterium]|nr:radical SAM protein [Desulfobacteraceae bacterium]